MTQEKMSCVILRHSVMVLRHCRLRSLRACVIAAGIFQTAPLPAAPASPRIFSCGPVVSIATRSHRRRCWR